MKYYNGVPCTCGIILKAYETPTPNHDNRKKASSVAEEPSREVEPEKVHEGKMAPHEFYNTQVLPFPIRAKKPSTDE